MGTVTKSASIGISDAGCFLEYVSDQGTDFDFRCFDANWSTRGAILAPSGSVSGLQMYVFAKHQHGNRKSLVREGVLKTIILGLEFKAKR